MRIANHNESSVKVSAFVLVSGASEVPAGPGASAACDRQTEDVRISAIVESERKLVQVKGQIVTADIVKGSHNATFQQAPKRFNVVGMDLAANILTMHVTNGEMGEPKISQFPIAAVIVSRNQVNLFIDSFTNESIKCSSVQHAQSICRRYFLCVQSRQQPPFCWYHQ